MATEQQRFDVYELLLKDMDMVIDYISKFCKVYNNKNILKWLRRFVADETDLSLEDICVIINEQIPHDHKDPLRLFFDEGLYVEKPEEYYH